MEVVKHVYQPASLMIVEKFKTNLEIWPKTFCTYFGTGDFGLLDHDEGRGNEGALSHIIYWVIGHGLQQVDGLLRWERHK